MSSNDVTPTSIYKDYTQRQLEATIANLRDKRNSLMASLDAIGDHFDMVNARYDTLMLQRPRPEREIERVLIESRDSGEEGKRVGLEMFSTNEKSIEVLEELFRRALEREKKQELERKG